MPLRHYYHLYCGGPEHWWKPIIEEHAAALASAHAQWDITLGLTGVVGPPPAWDGTCAWLTQHLPPSTTIITQQTGYEQLTLNALHRWAQTAPPDAPVLFTHAKGVTYHPGDPIPHAWRRNMTRHLIGDWPLCVTKIITGYDAVGCHWLTPQTDGARAPAPHFSGGFWWARADYIATLPPVSYTNRWDTEFWIGLNNPRVYDLDPGWPETLAAQRMLPLATMRENHIDSLTHLVEYHCTRCGQPFTLRQGDPEPDEEIRHCWDCIDEIFGRPKRSR